MKTSVPEAAIMNDKLISKIVNAYLPDAKHIAVLSTIKNDDQRAYLISACSDRLDKNAKLILFENGMSGLYSGEDEAVMELTDGLPPRGWLHVGGNKVTDKLDEKCRYQLPANYGYDSYFELVLAK